MREGLADFEPGKLYFEEFSGQISGVLVTSHRPDNTHKDRDTWFNHDYDGSPVPTDVVEKASEYAEEQQKRLGQLYYTRLILFMKNGDRGNISFDNLNDLLEHV